MVLFQISSLARPCVNCTAKTILKYCDILAVNLHYLVGKQPTFLEVLTSAFAAVSCFTT